MWEDVKPHTKAIQSAVQGNKEAEKSYEMHINRLKSIMLQSL